MDRHHDQPSAPHADADSRSNGTAVQDRPANGRRRTPPAFSQRVDGPRGDRPSEDRPPRRRERTDARTPDTWDIREAFLAFARERLTRTDQNDAARANAFLEQYGFTDDDVDALGFGLYPHPDEVGEHLDRCGFDAAAVRESGLTVDTRGESRTGWEGRIVLPIDDETGRCVDLAAIDPAPGPHRSLRVGLVRGVETSGVVAYGLNAALAEDRARTRLVLVEEILDAAYLSRRGLGPVAAVGGCGGNMTPRRWEELARIGVRSVTLAFREDDGRHDAVRDTLVHALRARTAPEVFVLEPAGPSDCETPAEACRVHGPDAAARMLRSRTLAFHGKDFGAAARHRSDVDWATRNLAPPAPEREPTPKPEPKPQPRPRRRPAGPSMRELLREMAGTMPTAAERSAAAAMFEDVDAALAAGDFDAARDRLHADRGLFREVTEDRESRESSRVSWEDGGVFHYAPRRHAERRETIWDRPSRAAFRTNGDRGTANGSVRSWFGGRTYRTVERDDARRTVRPLHAVLDALTEGRAAPLDPRLTDEVGAVPRDGAVTVLSRPDAAGRLAELCDRVADALEAGEQGQDDPGPLAVILRTVSPADFTTLLIAHLSRRVGGRCGLTAGDVRDRLAGRDRDAGYPDKPWLVDEAVDRLRTHGDRLTLIDAAECELSAALGRPSDAEGLPADLAGILCDTLDADELATLRDAAARHRCWAVAVTELDPRDCPAEPRRPAPRPTVSEDYRHYHALLGEWVTRA